MSPRSSSDNKKSGRLVRDIAESLGKVPPAAVELEADILGCVMLFKDVVKDVAALLKLDHFYTEQHKEIYSAIMALHAASSPVDMRTVTHQLRLSGKLEIVGGAFYVAELTEKVASKESLKFNMRIVMEMALKRRMIELASKIHHDAYEDDTDAIELLELSQNFFTRLHETEIAAPLSEQVRDIWKQIMVIDEPAWVEPYIRIQNTPVASAGEISLVVGKKKSRKSLFIVWLLTEFLKKHDGAMVFDTEQGKRHIWKARDRVFRVSKKLVPFLSMRDKAPAERMEIIEQTLSLWTPALKLIVIDGIRDLMSDINNPDESTTVMTWLQKISTKYNVHIITVLHLNKTDKNPRGHIGTELVNKAESTIELELDEKLNITTVKCESSREKGFESFAFTHSHDDLPMMADMPVGDRDMPLPEQRTRLIQSMNEGPLNYKDMLLLIRDNFGIGQRAATYKLGEFKRAGWLMTSGQQRSKNLMYILNISDNGQEQPPSGFKPLHDVKKKAEPELNFSESPLEEELFEPVVTEMPLPFTPPPFTPPPPSGSLLDLPF